jgi:ubiquinone/menaquinone biosynthesis C-methylase UbiE
MDQRAMVAGLFDRLADTYDQVGVDMIQPIASRLVAELAPRPGERVLDLGCGRGAALIPLGLAVGGSGSVTGVDLSARMVEAAAQAAAGAGIDASVVVGDAQEPSLPPAAYDVLCSSLVLFFLPDPPAALRAWRELLVDGGRLGVSTFGGFTTPWAEVEEVFTPYLPPRMLDARTSGATGPFSSDAGVEGLLRDAGFGQVRTVGDIVGARFVDHDHWYRWSWSVGQRAMWEAVPEEKRSEVKALAYERLDANLAEQGWMGFEQHARYTLGVR